MNYPEEFVNKVIVGDCLDILKKIPNNTLDAIVTDPPYGLSFMGKKWDYDVPSVEIWQECLRVLKPGGYLLSFAGTRTQHRMAVRIEDAGFEIRDMIAWVYGSGFPKSLNIGKAVDKIAERLNMFKPFAEHFKLQREKKGLTHKDIAVHFPSKTGGLTGCVWNWENSANVPTISQWTVLKPLLNLSDEFTPLIERIEREREVVGLQKKAMSGWNMDGTTQFKDRDITKGTSEWEGWGTALKPALEPITVARKPLEGTVAENCLKWGVGGINIDGCRVGTDEITQTRTQMKTWREKEGRSDIPESADNSQTTTQGRFPANFIHDGSDEVVSLFPNNSARFFYQAKASKSERNRGCEGLEEKQTVGGGGGIGDYLDDVNSASGKYGSEKAPSKNNHPTVKPVTLMEYLVTLVSKENHVVLDPFAGSGSTLIACKNLKRNYIGIEREPEYVQIANARLMTKNQQVMNF